MQWYKEIPIWENRRRQKKLSEFRADLVAYFEDYQFSPQSRSRLEGENAKKQRVKLNLNLHEIHYIIGLGSIDPILQPTAANASIRQPVDVFINLFRLGDLRISNAEVLDFIDQSIGAYRAEERAAWIRTINPFWWFARALIWFGRLPIWFLGELGFNAEEIEKKTWGKILKGVATAIGAIGASLTALNLLGLLARIKAYFGIVP